MNKCLFSILLLAALTACKNDAKAPETALQPDSATQPAPAATESEEEKNRMAAPPPAQPARVLGAYSGASPCLDCKSIQTELTLYEIDDLATPASYHLRETFIGTKNGDQTHETSGKYAIVLGAGTNKTAVVYQLDPDTPAESRFFLRLDDNRLQRLDKDRKAFPGKPDILTKTR